MGRNIEECQSVALEIIALMDILNFVLQSDHTDEIENLQLATLTNIINEKMQDLANKIDQEIVKNAIEQQ